jgi:hypothetical protein
MIKKTLARVKAKIARSRSPPAKKMEPVIMTKIKKQRI